MAEAIINGIDEILLNEENDDTQGTKDQNEDELLEHDQSMESVDQTTQTYQNEEASMHINANTETRPKRLCATPKDYNNLAKGGQKTKSGDKDKEKGKKDKEDNEIKKRDREITSLKDELNRITGVSKKQKNEINQQREQIKHLKEQNENLKVKNTEINRKLDIQIQELNEVKEKIEKREREEPRGYVKKLEKKQNSLEEEIEKLKNEIKNKDEILARRQSTIDYLINGILKKETETYAEQPSKKVKTICLMDSNKKRMENFLPDIVDEQDSTPTYRVEDLENYPRKLKKREQHRMCNHHDWH